MASPVDTSSLGVDLHRKLQVYEAALIEALEYGGGILEEIRENPRFRALMEKFNLKQPAKTEQVGQE